MFHYWNVKKLINFNISFKGVVFMQNSVYFLASLMCRLHNFADAVLSFNCSTVHATSLVNFVASLKTKQNRLQNTECLYCYVLLEHHDILCSI